MTAICKKCDCNKKAKNTETECTTTNSCLDTAEKDDLDAQFKKGYFKQGSTGNKKFSNRMYLAAYAKKLYSSDNSVRADCARRRKCLLRTKKDTENGACCPGMTGHHIIPGSSLKKGSLSGCYTHQNALTVCALGETNHKGLHGEFHKKLRNRVKALRPKNKKKKICSVKYPKMLNAGVRSFMDVTEGQCDEECIKLALRSNLQKQCPGKHLDKADVDAVWGCGPGKGTKNERACTKYRRTAGFPSK